MTTVRRRRRRQLRLAGWATSLAVAAGVAVLAAERLGSPLFWLLPIVTALVWHRWMKDEGGVAILNYHSISAHSDWLPWAERLSVSPETFERHLRLLRRRRCHVVSTRRLLAARRDAAPLPPRCVVLHLDDGYLDNWVAALPLLRRHRMPATVFVSLDFIEPGETPRPTLDDVAVGRGELRWDGYLNWAELRRLQSSERVDVQAHGTDHGRVESGERIVDVVSPDNWRWHAWVQWAAMPGNKSAWYRHRQPPAVACGTPVRESRPALAAPVWRPDGPETAADHERRVRSVLLRSRAVLEERLGRDVLVFCWPENVVPDRGRQWAEEAGYQATTGGRGENRAEEDPRVLSRVHGGDRALGWKWPLLDDLILYARIRVVQGNYYWYSFLGFVNLASRLTFRLILGRPKRR